MNWRDILRDLICNLIKSIEPNYDCNRLIPAGDGDAPDQWNNELAAAYYAGIGNTWSDAQKASVQEADKAVYEHLQLPGNDLTPSQQSTMEHHLKGIYEEADGVWPPQ